MSAPALAGSEVRSVRVRIAGRVQGFGVRPWAVRLAHEWGLAGNIANTTDGVALELMGRKASIDSFLAAFRSGLPAGAAIENVVIEPIPPLERNGFEIADCFSSGPISAAIPGDLVACADCLCEVRDQSERRHAYPFTSCTACGPRYSIISEMPYDRSATAMSGFALCAHCGNEYRTIDDRRFHAQTIACPECGPQLWLKDAAGRMVGPNEALTTAAALLREGRIIALKGLGGYQLLVDATSPQAVQRLRHRKNRPIKPLAVLVGSLEQAAALAELTSVEQRLLTDRAGPIVVVRRRAEALLADNIAPGFSTVGLMLPTTPLHALLCDHFARPLVCTSGNREGEPLAYDEQSAETVLSGIADAWLHHNRPILRPVDDSVVRVVDGQLCILRLARGYAPLTLPRPGATKIPLIALGGEQKSAIAISNGAQAVLGPHIGDLSGAANCERWEQQMASLAALYGVSLDEACFIHDLHPEYFSTQWAARFQRRMGVQHHHAHIAAVMLEHGMLDREVLGLAWDGTGYGDDGTIWGGECLRATALGYQRVAWLRPFPLPGGEQAVREPWRVAVALVCDAVGREAARQLCWPDVSQQQLEAAVNLLGKPQLSPRTSSMGRLFDGIASLTLGLANALDEGRPAMLLEDACDRESRGEYAFAVSASNGAIDWRPVVSAVVADLRQGVSAGAVAMRFHRAVANLAIVQAQTFSDLPLVTGGGVFQNAVLVELMAERLSSRRRGWLRPAMIPPGDGGLAAGQLAIAAARLQRFKG